MNTLKESPLSLLPHKTLSSEEIYKGLIVRLLVDQAELPDGKSYKREVIQHPGGAVVIATLPNGNLLLVRQYRYPLQQWLYEFPAGKLDPGEDPLTSIRRELEEETGYHAEHWEELTSVYTTPGFCDEKIYLFKATGLVKLDQPQREEDEYIDIYEVSPAELWQMVRAGRMIDAKTLCALALVYPEPARA